MRVLEIFCQFFCVKKISLQEGLSIPPNSPGTSLVLILTMHSLEFYPSCFFRWQYFGSVAGLARLYPGREWDTNFAGFYNDYDPRVRPWYIAATSGPKDVVIILDCRSVGQIRSSDNLV